jgi:hypothetical protein
MLKVGMNYRRRFQRTRWREWEREYGKWGTERMGTDRGLRGGSGRNFVGIEKYAGLVMF